MQFLRLYRLKRKTTCYDTNDRILTLGSVGGGPFQRGGCLVMVVTLLDACHF